MQWKNLAATLAVAAMAIAPVLAQIEGNPARVDEARIRAADSEPGEWLSVSRTYDEQRFSPLDQINDTNVSRLGLAWSADLDADRGVEATPLVVDGVLYNITPWNITSAYDATTGKLLWRYDPEVPRRFGGLACCDIVSRGVAAWHGKIYIATLDGRVIALDAKTGKPVWSVQTFDPLWPYTITGAPRIYAGKVVIGNAGAEGAARGYVTAFDAETGKQAWRFNIVPGDPAKGYSTKAEAAAAKTWKGEWWKQGGGGTAWDAFAYDPKLRLVYIGTGNGGPWARDVRSPGGGDNLYISSIVAVDVDTGEYRWHYQETPGDQWDYTATQPIILADLKLKGRVRQVLMQAPKNGFFYILDRKTGELLSANPYVPGITWAKGIDLKTGRPIENPEARYGTTPVLISPNAGGGHNWHPMAYSPKTGLVYLPVLQSAMAYALDPNFKLNPGKTSQLGLAMTGNDAIRSQMAAQVAATTKSYLAAFDPVAGREVWRVPYPRRGSGGTMVTAGNLVFEGTVSSTFAAYNALTGAKLWEMPVQNVPIAGAMTYSVKGVQYVAINAGWGGGIAHGPSTNDAGLILGKTRLLVFKLDGKAALPALESQAMPTAETAPPPSTASAAQIAQGEKAFAQTCAACHGESARGGIKDLRKMSAQTRSQFFEIVLGGIRQEKGMVSFAGTISNDDAVAINAYLIKRANEDWTGTSYKQ